MNASFLQSDEWGEFQKHLGKDVLFKPLAIRHNLLHGFHYWYMPFIENIPAKLPGVNDKKCLFVRVELIHNITLPKGARKVTNIQPARTLLLDLNKTPEDLLSGMHSKTRYNIKLAEKHSVEVRELTSEPETKQGIKLLAETETRHGFRGHGESYYKKMFAFLNQEGKIETKLFGAWKGNELLSVGLFIDYEDTRTYLFGGSSEQNKNLMAPYLLHWKAITDAKQHGMAKYDFWGIETSSGKTPGFVRFKIGFGGEIVEYMGAYDIVLKPFWYNVYSILRKVIGFIR